MPLPYWKQTRLGANQQHVGIPPRLAASVGLAVDNLSRYLLCRQGFEVAWQGIDMLQQLGSSKFLVYLKLFAQTYEQIQTDIATNSFNRKTIRSALQLIQLDSIYRAQVLPDPAMITLMTQLDDTLLEYIKHLTLLTAAHIHQLYNLGGQQSLIPGFDMRGGYTSRIGSGDGDYLINGEILDIKTSKYPPKTSHTLQVMIYALLGQRSTATYWQTFTGILRLYNPILNTEWSLDLKEVDPKIVAFVNRHVIGVSD